MRMVPGNILEKRTKLGICPEFEIHKEAAFA